MIPKLLNILKEKARVFLHPGLILHTVETAWNQLGASTTDEAQFSPAYLYDQNILSEINFVVDRKISIFRTIVKVNKASNWQIVVHL